MTGEKSEAELLTAPPPVGTVCRGSEKPQRMTAGIVIVKKTRTSSLPDYSSSYDLKVMKYLWFHGFSV